jgi:hypothetical protein
MRQVVFRSYGLGCALLLAAACNHSYAHLPCTEIGSQSCGTTCVNDGDCGAGLFCGDDKRCAAECTFSDNRCVDGATCDAHGRCVSPADNGDLSVHMTVCPAGLMCDVQCTGSTTTTISGKVYDPAGKNPLYNVAVYVPENPLTPLPKGVPTGAAACSCGALYTSGSVVSTSTAEDGSFTLPNAPVGSAVPLVIQIGKWRRLFKLNIASCQDNPQADHSLKFLGTIPAGDTDDSIPDIAVSTGSADTLECLMQRIGIPKSEYVAGTASTGHVHVFSGGKSGCGMSCSGGVGKVEQGGMAGAPESNTNLWMSQDQLMPYDIVLLSCEGGETYKANPPALESYLNAGGRVFASHFHYAWFSGPIDSMGQNYTAPADWGSHIATWAGGGGQNGGPIGGIIQTVLNGSMTAFPKGVALQKWLTNVGALGKNGVPMGELSIYDPRYNAKVTTANSESQSWIQADSGSGHADSTMYLSFDTPTNAPINPDLGAPNYCGRAVFSDLHVGAAANDNPPDCASGDLSPQEKALEFMLFDLSACVVSDSVPPPIGVPIL